MDLYRFPCIFFFLFLLLIFAFYSAIDHDISFFDIILIHCIWFNMSTSLSTIAQNSLVQPKMNWFAREREREKKQKFNWQYRLQWKIYLEMLMFSSDISLFFVVRACVCVLCYVQALESIEYENLIYIWAMSQTKSFE